MKNILSSPIKRIRGFTLIEMGIALVVLGVVTVAILQIEKVNDNRLKRVLTEQRIQRIAQSLSEYAASASRLPCPADPSENTEAFGHEWGVRPADMLVALRPLGRTPSVNPTHTCDTTNSVGIVPFQTLGLSYDQALDAWGRPFTYAVSPVFTQDNDLSDDQFDFDGDANITEPQDRPTTAAGPDEAEVVVHAACRTPAWIVDGDNSNAPKAMFCCAGVGQSSVEFNNNSDLIVQTLAGDTFSPVDRDDLTNPSPMYNPVDSIFLDGDGFPLHWSDSVTPSDKPITAVAYTLVSHGPNGLGSFLANDTMGQYRNAFRSGPEIENSNNDQIFMTGEPSANFDDILYWDTQLGVIAHGGSASCAGP